MRTTSIVSPKLRKLIAAEIKALQDENDRLKSIIDAAKKRCGDAKAVHSRLVDGKPMYQVRDEAYEAVTQMEQIVYSVYCYLDGVPGQYLPAR